jgi:hypothetical protein
MAALPCFINGINSRGRADTAAMAAPVNLIFVVAGAGCGSMGRYLPQYFTGLEGESGATRISVLQKRHISDQASGDECSEAFIRADHLSQWRPISGHSYKPSYANSNNKACSHAA